MEINKNKDINTNNIIIAFLIFGIPFLMGLGVDLYVPSLPKISEYFNTPSIFVQSTISLYMLGYGIGQLFLGVLSDSYGRKKLLIFSGLVFTTVSFLSITSNSIFILNMYRFIQGLGIAGLAVVARAMIVDVYKGKFFSKAIIYFGLSWSLGPIIGPFIGGYLQTMFNWKASFYLFGIYGLIIFLLASIKLPETNKSLTNFEYKIFYKNIKKICLCPSFILITIIGGIGYGMIVVFNTVGPFLIESTLKYSAFEYGKIALLLGIAYFIGSLFNRYLISKNKIMNVMLFGIVGTFIVSLLMMLSFFFIGVNLIVIIISIWVVICFCGLIVPCSLSKTMEIFPNLAGTSSSIFGTLSAIVVSLITLISGNFKVQNQLTLSEIYILIITIAIILYSLNTINERRKDFKLNTNSNI